MAKSAFMRGTVGWSTFGYKYTVREKTGAVWRRMEKCGQQMSFRQRIINMYNDFDYLSFKILFTPYPTQKF